MAGMTIKQLEECRAAALEAERYRERAERLRAEMERTTPRYSLTGGGGGGVDGKMERMIATYLEVLDRYRVMIAEREALVQEVEDWLQTLPPDDRAVLRYHYVDGLTWTQSERRAGYSARANSKQGWYILRKYIPR